MEMERINENTIRVLIENEDLADRGITFLDLLGNHKQIESFFYSILEEVDVEDQFQESDAITFQVLPNRDGLELFISKNLTTDDAIDLTTISENANGFSEMLKKHMENQELMEEEEDEVEEYLENPEMPTSHFVVHLHQFEDLIQLANECYLQNAVTNLYSFQNQYFFEVIFLVNETTEEEMTNEKAQLLEYGEQTAVTPEILAEYGERIMERTALELTRYYFK